MCCCWFSRGINLAASLYPPLQSLLRAPREPRPCPSTVPVLRCAQANLIFLGFAPRRPLGRHATERASIVLLQPLLQVPSLVLLMRLRRLKQLRMSQRLRSVREHGPAHVHEPLPSTLVVRQPIMMMLLFFTEVELYRLLQPVQPLPVLLLFLLLLLEPRPRPLQPYLLRQRLGDAQCSLISG